MPDKIYKVWHTLVWKGRNYGHFITDLQYDDGVPYAVFEWLNTYEGEVPSVRIKLDPKYLHNLAPKHLHHHNSGVATHLYELPLTWPKESPPKIINQDKNPFPNK